MNAALTNDYIIYEIFGHLSLIQKPFTFDTALRPHWYWRPRERPWSVKGPMTEFPAAKDDETSVRRRALHSLALTCRSFSERALDELWAAPQGGLYTLLGLLSGFVAREGTYWDHRFRPKQKKPKMDHFFITEEISDEEWTTFQRYASRVREIGYHAYWGWRAHYRIDPSVFEILHSRAAGEPLFPKLQFLTWQRSARNSREPDSNLEQDAKVTLLLQMLIVPAVTTAIAFWHPCFLPVHKSIFQLSSTVDTTGHNQDIETISSTRPSLRHVLLQLEYDTPALHSLTVKCHEIRTFIAHGRISSNALPSLARLRHLKVLEVHSLGPSEPDTCNLPPGAFPSIETIVLKQIPLALAARLLASVTSRALSSCTLQSDEEMDPFQDDIHHLSSALCSPPFTASLIVLHLRLHYEYTPPEPHHTIFRFGDALGHALLHLTRLRTLTIDVTNRLLALTDGDVLGMGAAWPHVSALSVTYGFEHDDWQPRAMPSGMANPSIHGLIGLALACKQLRFLQCDVADVGEEDLRRLEERAAQLEAADRRDTMEGLILRRGMGFEGLLLLDPQRLARAVRRIFPNIKGVQGVDAEGRWLEETFEELWPYMEGTDGYQYLFALDNVPRATEID